jgi:hypothetical protein
MTTNEPHVGDDQWPDDWPEWARDPTFAEARHIPWRDMPKFGPLNQHPNTRRYVEWMRLTHNGRRTPLNVECDECHESMTDEQIADYEAALGRPPDPSRWV